MPSCCVVALRRCARCSVRNITFLSITLVAAPARAATAGMPPGQRHIIHVDAGKHIPTDTAFSRWLTAYGKAWSAREPEAMVALFSPNAAYREDPFDSATSGRAAIRADWVDIARHQQDIHFRYEVLSTNEQRGIAHWIASFVRRPSGEAVQLDGILMATFNPAGECTEFREWWHRRTREPPKSR